MPKQSEHLTMRHHSRAEVTPKRYLLDGNATNVLKPNVGGTLWFSLFRLRAMTDTLEGRNLHVNPPFIHVEILFGQRE